MAVVKTSDYIPNTPKRMQDYQKNLKEFTKNATTRLTQNQGNAKYMFSQKHIDDLKQIAQAKKFSEINKNAKTGISKQTMDMFEQNMKQLNSMNQNKVIQQRKKAVYKAKIGVAGSALMTLGNSLKKLPGIIAPKTHGGENI